MKDSEALYKKLQETELTRYQMLDLTFGMKELAEAIGSRDAWETLRHTRRAIQHLEEFRGNIIPTPELNEEEANLSMGLHTYMRKGMDCPLGNLMHGFISENRGRNIWFSFIKSVTQTQKDSPKYPLNRVYDIAIRSAEECYRTANDTSDDGYMLSLLKMWEENFPDAMEWMKE